MADRPILSLPSMGSVPSELELRASDISAVSSNPFSIFIKYNLEKSTELEKRLQNEGATRSPDDHVDEPDVWSLVRDNEGRCHRALVINKYYDDRGECSYAETLFVDSGEIRVVEIVNIFTIPPNLVSEYPTQCLRIIPQGILPGSEHWLLSHFVTHPKMMIKIEFIPGESSSVQLKNPCLTGFICKVSVGYETWISLPELCKLVREESQMTHPGNLQRLNSHHELPLESNHTANGNLDDTSNLSGTAFKPVRLNLNSSVIGIQSKRINLDSNGNVFHRENVNSSGERGGLSNGNHMMSAVINDTPESSTTSSSNESQTEESVRVKPTEIGKNKAGFSTEIAARVGRLPNSVPGRYSPINFNIPDDTDSEGRSYGECNSPENSMEYYECETDNDKNIALLTSETFIRKVDSEDSDDDSKSSDGYNDTENTAPIDCLTNYDNKTDLNDLEGPKQSEFLTKRTMNKANEVKQKNQHRRKMCKSFMERGACDNKEFCQFLHKCPIEQKLVAGTTALVYQDYPEMNILAKRVPYFVVCTNVDRNGMISVVLPYGPLTVWDVATKKHDIIQYEFRDLIETMNSTYERLRNDTNCRLEKDVQQGVLWVESTESALRHVPRGWYRIKVISHSDNQKCLVYLVDHGATIEVERKCLYSLHKNLIQFRKQAIRCRLQLHDGSRLRLGSLPACGKIESYRMMFDNLKDQLLVMWISEIHDDFYGVELVSDDTETHFGEYLHRMGALELVTGIN